MSTGGILMMMAAADTAPPGPDFAAVTDSATQPVLRAYDFDGTDITAVGNAYNLPITVGGNQEPLSLTALAPNEVAYLYRDNLLRGGLVKLSYDPDTGDWSQVGNTKTFTDLHQSNRVTAMSESRVAFCHKSVVVLETWDFDGSDWTKTGNSTVSGDFQNPLRGLTNTTITARTFPTSQAQWTFDGSDWSSGDPTRTTPTSNADFTMLSSTLMLYANEGGTPGIAKYTVSGTSWVISGSALGIPAMTWPSVAALSADEVVLANKNTSTLRVYDVSGATPVAVGNSLALVTPEGNTVASFAFSIL